MVCPTIHTGPGFLSGTLYAIDCHARVIGSYGYGALADPGSTVSLALTGLVTIFVALFGLRLLLGPGLTPRDLILDVLRIGLVLAIASAWPAWRTVVYDLVLDGPVEVARAIGVSSGLPGSNAAITRLQQADDGIILATSYGSGRLTGGVSAGADMGDVASGVAVSDGTAFGVGRTAFLVSTIGSFAIVRLCAGILLAVAPLMAGLALFSWTIDVFTGWLRALAFCALGSLVLFIAQGAMLALLFPWLSAVLQQRRDNVLAVSAPTELLALTLGFAVLTAAALFLVARLTFFSSARLSVLATSRHGPRSHQEALSRRVMPMARQEAQVSRADLLVGAVQSSMQRSDRTTEQTRRLELRSGVSSGSTSPTGTPQTTNSATSPLLGDSFRRNHRRMSTAAGKRNTAG